MYKLAGASPLKDFATLFLSISIKCGFYVECEWRLTTLPIGERRHNQRPDIRGPSLT